jgi:hypothetical protein
MQCHKQNHTLENRVQIKLNRGEGGKKRNTHNNKSSKQSVIGKAAQAVKFAGIAGTTDPPKRVNPSQGGDTKPTGPDNRDGRAAGANKQIWRIT